MNKLSTKDRVALLNILAEGAGVNAACRITGKSKTTVLKLLADVGVSGRQEPRFSGFERAVLISGCSGLR